MMDVRRPLALFVLLLPGMVSALPRPAWADIQAILACRQLAPGAARAECLERATADLARQQAGGGPAVSGTAGMTARPEGPAAKARFTAGIEAITYRDGRPVFRLDNGQTWYSMDRRRLTFKRDRSYATIEKTPVGMLLHYNGSFFALQVVPAQG